jgi:hypothetical protein
VQDCPLYIVEGGKRSQDSTYNKLSHFCFKKVTQHCWLMPVILATWEAEVRKIRFKASQANSS